MRVIQAKNEARRKLLNGANAVADIVRSTLGPKGKNVIVQRGIRTPLITNDGVSIAQEIELEDEIENLGAQTLIEVARQTDEKAGDGTTTSIVLAQKLLEGYVDTEEETLLSNSSNSVDTYKRIMKGKDEVIEKLTKKAKKVKGKADVVKVAQASVEDEELGERVADTVYKVGIEGFVSVEDGLTNDIDIEVIKGMKFYGTYAADFMMTNEKRQAVWENVPVLVTNTAMEHTQDLTGLVERCVMASEEYKQSKLVVVAPKFSKAILYSIYQTAQAKLKQLNGGAFQILAVKAPSLTDDHLEDVAVYCDAKFYNKENGDKVRKAQLSDLGFIEKIVVDEDDVVLTGGRGNVEERIKVLKGHLEAEKDSMFKKKIERRISSLASSIGIIRVGASTESEQNYLKYKIEDSIKASQAAMEEGVIRGAGVELKELAEELGEEHVLYEALNAPYNQIQENAGGDLDISDDIIDPLKVVRFALENACSVAGTLLTAEAAIADKKEKLVDELEKMLKGQ